MAWHPSLLGNGKCAYSPQNSLRKYAVKEKSRSFFVISIDFFTGYRYNNNGGE